MEKTAQHFKRCSDNDYVEKVLPPAVDDFVPNGRIIPQPSSYRNSAPILRGFMDFETLHKKLPDDFCQPCHSILKNLNTNSKIEIFCKHNHVVHMDSDMIREIDEDMVKWRFGERGQRY